MMYAVEFETIIHDDLIQVPATYRGFENKKIRVILLDTLENQPIRDLPDGFHHPLKVASYNFGTRAEIYDREKQHIY